MTNPRAVDPHRFQFIVGLAALLAGALVAGLVRNAYGAEPVDPFEASPEQLFSAKVISATRTNETWWTTPAAVYVLSNEDIARSGATSIPEALRLVPGVNVARINASSWAVSVRGFNSSLANKLLVLIDGREVYNTLFSGVYWDAQDTLLEDIERIEVVRGPGASLWGSNAVNGVINIITKSAGDTHGVLASALVGDEEDVGVVRSGGAIGNDGHYRVFGKYNYRDDQRALTGGSGDDEWQAGRGGFRADWGDEDRRGAFTLQGDGYAIDDDGKSATPLLVPPFATVQERGMPAQGADLLGRWTRELSDGARFTVQSYVDYTYRDLGIVDDENFAFDLDAQYERRLFDWNQLLVGARYRYAFNDLSSADAQLTFGSARRDYSIVSGFIQDRIAFTDDFALTLGSKFEQNEFTGFEAQPNARAQWQPTKHQMVWASIARAVRTPSRIENDVDIDLATIPPSAIMPVPVLVQLQHNSHFDSEKLIAYEFGYRLEWSPRLLFDVAVFYNDYDDLKTNALLPATLVDDGVNPVHFELPIAATNDTHGETYGIEIATSWRPWDVLTVSAAYSYLEMELDGPPSAVAIDAEGAEHQSPEHQFNVRSMWDVTDDVSLDSTLYYVSELPSFGVDDYWRLDLGGRWRVGNGVELGVTAQNLFDVTHREFSRPTDLNATAIQRSVYGKVTWRF